MFELYSGCKGLRPQPFYICITIVLTPHHAVVPIQLGWLHRLHAQRGKGHVMLPGSHLACPGSPERLCACTAVIGPCYTAQRRLTILAQPMTR